MYKIYIGSLILIGAILPLLAVEFYHEGTSWDMFFRMYSEDTKDTGFFYTIISSAVLVLVATHYSPNRKKSVIEFFRLSPKIRKICFQLGITSVILEIVLNIILGMTQSNTIQQRPLVGAILTYIYVVLRPGVFVYIYDDLLSKKISKKGAILLILYLVTQSTAGSRYSLVSLYMLIVCCLAYATEDTRLISKSDEIINNARKIKNFKLYSLFALCGIVTVILGQLIRYDFDFSSLNEIVAEGVVRFYLNNVALYLAIENQEKIYQILMDNQPAVLLSQFVSIFGIPRELPSSFRLLEWWGGIVQESSAGHISGYAYGWLGLTYGLLEWNGLIIIALILSFLFKTMKLATVGNVTLGKRLVFIVASQMLLEFITNLGLDSYVEKVVKQTEFSLIFYFLVLFVLSVVYSNGDFGHRNLVSTNNK